MPKKDRIIADCLIIGAGTSGSYIARRLSESSSESICLVEAGTSSSDSLNQFLWQGFDRTGGRTLGGTSSVTRFPYLSASPSCYASWPQSSEYPDIFSFVSQYLDFPLLEISDNLNESPYPLNVSLNKQNKRLLVLTSTTALRLLWHEDTQPLSLRSNGSVRQIKRKKLRAVGVVAMKSGVPVQIYARRRIIVTMGFQTSSFLQRSGVGDPKHLHSLGIPIILNLPNIGVGLKNHPFVLAISLDSPSSLYSFYSDPRTSEQTRAICVHSFYCVLSDVESKKYWMYRNLRYLIASIPLNEIKNGFYVNVVILLQPKSSGRVRILSSDPFVPAETRLNLLYDDLMLFREAFLKYLPNTRVPNDTNLLDQYIRTYVDSLPEYCCDVRMGSEESGACINSHHRIYGTKNVYVADSSGCPTLVDVYPTLSIIAFAETLVRRLRKGTEANTNEESSIKDEDENDWIDEDEQSLNVSWDSMKH